MPQNNLLFLNARLVNKGSLRDCDILIENGIVSEIGDLAAQSKILDEKNIYDLNRSFILPGFIETHTHGAVGVDVNYIDKNKLDKLSRYYASCGVCSFFVSLLPCREEKLLSLLEFYAQAMSESLPAAQLAGIHLEGPAISKNRRGAIKSQYIKALSLDNFKRYQEAAQGHIKYITIAPETEGALDLIEKIAPTAVVCALGHSEADYETTMEAIKRGARLASHFPNGMSQPHHRHPGIVTAILESNISVELILDGLHVHPAMLHLIANIVGTDRIIAVSDSMMATAMPDGNEYYLGDKDNKVRVKDGVALLSQANNLAGSRLNAITALRNAMTYLQKDFTSIVPLFTTNPAELFALDGGSLQVGDKANLLVMDEHYQLRKTFVSGEQVYSSML